jgi:hypothetical protein
MGGIFAGLCYAICLNDSLILKGGGTLSRGCQMKTAKLNHIRRCETEAAFAPIHAELLDSLSHQADLVAIRNARSEAAASDPERFRLWRWPAKLPVSHRRKSA